MEGVIFNIKQFAIHDGPGIRTTLFLKGCCCDCWWCHNPESKSSAPVSVERKFTLEGKVHLRNEIIGERFSVDDVMKEILKDKVFFEESEGGVTFSGGEPTVQMDFLCEVLKACKLSGLHTALDTCGHFSHADLERLIPLVDLFLWDLKMVDPVRHKTYIGVDNKLIISNLEILLKCGAQVWVRIPIIPEVNSVEVDAMVEMLSKLPPPEQINLLPFHKIGSGKYDRFKLENRMESLSEPSEKLMEEVSNKFEKQGFKVIIGG